MNKSGKYLVLSDSHGYLGRLDGILMAAEAAGPFDGVIHLGDGYRDLDKYREHLPPVIQVPGNCDALYTSPDTPLVRVIDLDGGRILIAHGHTLYVRTGTEGLMNRARAEGACAALYGHTHIPKAEYRNGILIMNPGAAMNGRWGILTVAGGTAEGILR